MPNDTYGRDHVVSHGYSYDSKNESDHVEFASIGREIRILRAIQPYCLQINGSFQQYHLPLGN